MNQFCINFSKIYGYEIIETDFIRIQYNFQNDGSREYQITKP